MLVHRTLAFDEAWQNPRLHWLLTEFRLIVNKSIRIALRSGIRSKTLLSQAAYADLSREHRIYKQYICSAFEVALNALKTRRRRARRGEPIRPPFMTGLMAKVENQGFRFDRRTGLLRVAICGGECVELQLPVSNWHRSFLDDPSWSLGSLTIVPGRILLAIRRPSIGYYTPQSVLALDTNEDSLDGVAAVRGRSVLLTVNLGGIRNIQTLHFRRRRRMARKKRNDRRVMRSLLAKDGSREHNRIETRLHRVTKALVVAARASQSAIAMEDLRLLRSQGKTRGMNRRISSWPRGELHRQIEYKAALAGVLVIKVNPAWTSKTCPVCGARRRDRVGQDFVCLMCDWEMDRQHNAACNILLSALASNEALARGVRFHPGALRKDVVSPLYAVPALLGGAREEPSGVESPTSLCCRSRTEPSLSKQLRTVSRACGSTVFY